ncbi:hypothetical protein ABZ912_42765 [Nonomuraea angiospora]|uniref:hypothetical protein n=1 Tax=Nonomuraea angiospora TaxID=46172 RepID=UPI0033C0AE85
MTRDLRPGTANFDDASAHISTPVEMTAPRSGACLTAIFAESRHQEAATAAGRQQAPRPGQILYVNRMDESRMTVWGRGSRSEVIQEINREYWIPPPIPAAR